MPYKSNEIRRQRTKEIRAADPEKFRRLERANYRKNAVAITTRKRMKRNNDAFRAKRRKSYLIKQPTRTDAERFKMACRQRVSRAIKDGLMSRQPCYFCGSVHTEAHHQDYAKPYDVMWLCSAHHHRLHNAKEWWDYENR